MTLMVGSMAASLAAGSHGAEVVAPSYSQVGWGRGGVGWDGEDD